MCFDTEKICIQICIRIAYIDAVTCINYMQVSYNEIVMKVVDFKFLSFLWASTETNCTTVKPRVMRFYIRF